MTANLAVILELCGVENGQDYSLFTHRHMLSLLRIRA